MIIITDLHLTDRERDNYRWEFLSWLKLKMVEMGEERLWILGDLTDQKDGHSAKLVNRIVDTLLELASSVTVLAGNHDYKDPACPFFRFLGNKHLRTEKLRFVSQVAKLPFDGGTALWLPHSRQPANAWQGFTTKDVDVILCHQTYDGADAGRVRLSSGLSSTYWSHRGFKKLVFSGDIHVPQEIGDVMYVGCQYPIAFGDSFTPRMIQFDEGEPFSIKVPSIQRASLDLDAHEELSDYKLKAGDQAKVRMHLPRTEFGAWAEHKANLINLAEEIGVELFSIELVEKKNRKRSRLEDPKAKAPVNKPPVDLLREFCQTRGLHESLEAAGVDLLEEE